jgi:hypothetical protein
MTMENDSSIDPRIRARDGATRRLNRLTAGVALGALASMGIVSGVSAYTLPGVAADTGATASTSTPTASTPTGLQSSGSVGSSSGTGVAVSGGS